VNTSAGRESPPIARRFRSIPEVCLPLKIFLCVVRLYDRIVSPMLGNSRVPSLGDESCGMIAGSRDRKRFRHWIRNCRVSQEFHLHIQRLSQSYLASHSVEFASFSFPFNHVDDDHFPKDRKIRGARKAGKWQMRTLEYLREFDRAISITVDRSDASRCSSDAGLSRDYPFIPSLFAIRSAIIVVIAICRGTGKCACASSCNAETALSAGRFSDRGITAEIALSSTPKRASKMNGAVGREGGRVRVRLPRWRFFLPSVLAGLYFRDIISSNISRVPSNVTFRDKSRRL